MQLTPRTSQSDPLRFARINCGIGRVIMTICPGKIGPSQSGAPWQRDLKTDLAAIVDARATHLITLMEWDEMRRYSVPSLGIEARKAGLEWHHFPFEDRSTPGPSMRYNWRSLSELLKRGLHGGAVIAVHCLGGLGRSGVVASMILQDRNIQPAESMEMIRAARPGAIENAAQEEFIMGYRDWREGRGAAEGE